MSDFLAVNMSALLGMVWIVLRSVEADRHKMDSGYRYCFIALCLIFIAIGFQGQTMFYLYRS